MKDEESLSVSCTTHKPTKSHSVSITMASTDYLVLNVCQVSVVTCVEPVEASAALVFCPG